MVLKNLIYSHTSKIKLYFSKYHKSNTIAFPIRQQIIGNIYTEIKDNIFFNCKDRLHAYNCVDMFTRKELDKIGYLNMTEIEMFEFMRKRLKKLIQHKKELEMY